MSMNNSDADYKSGSTRKKRRIARNSNLENIVFERTKMNEATKNWENNNENTEATSVELQSSQKSIEEKNTASIQVYQDDDNPKPVTKALSLKNSQSTSGRSPLTPVTINSRVTSNEENPHQVDANDSKEPDLSLIAERSFFLYKRKIPVTPVAGENYFNKLSDEMILQIFKWLPKKNLMRCSLVSNRFNRIVNTASLWTRLDLGCKCLKPSALGNIIARGVVILRLAQTEINDPIFNELTSNINVQEFESKLQYLDLSMSVISKTSLELLLSKCRKLKKLSLEHVVLNDAICIQIAANKNLETLNLTMCEGISMNGTKLLAENLLGLRSLNISWTYLSVQSVAILVTSLTPALSRLNIAGCRNSMTDNYLAALIKRCPDLVELDISDCPKLTNDGLRAIADLKSLEYLAISRCYSIDVATFLSAKLTPSLAFLNVFGIMREESIEILSQTYPSIGFNKFMHSSVARPTVGTRRTSIWGLRTRD